LSLGGERATWLDVGFGNNEYNYVHSVALRGRRLASGELIREGRDDGGATVESIGADAAVAVYGVVRWRGCEGDGSAAAEPISGCRSTELGGQVIEMSPRRRVLQEVPPPGAIAVSGSRIAVASPVLETCACNGSPAWSRDGTEIAYDTRNLDVDWEVVVARPGGRLTRVTNNWSQDYSPDWSPDGSRLAYVSFEGDARNVGLEGDARIVVSKRDGTDRHTVASGLSPAWAPSGNQIAFDGEAGGVWIVSADGTRQRMLPGSESGGSEPAWSPDGTQLAFVKNIEGWAGQIVVQRADGTGEQRVIASGRLPTWSPSGDQIAYVHGTYERLDLRAVRLDGTGDRLLVGNVGSGSSDTPGGPDWSPDGSKVAFVRDGELYTVSPSDGVVTRLTRTRPRRYRAPVEIRTTHGALVSRFLPKSNPGVVLLSQDVAATYSVGKRSGRLELFTPSSGRRIGTDTLPRTASWLSLARRTLVYASGREIWVLDTHTHKRRLLLTTRADPVGLSIEGNRVAWAENLAHTSTIRAILLP
jgi:Tol biopolymer transport system component